MEMLMGLGGAIAFVFFAIFFGLFAFLIYLEVKIVKKAGFSGWVVLWAMLFGWIIQMVIPGTIGFVLAYAPIVAFAFMKWPVDKAAASMDQDTTGTTPPAA